MSILCLSENGIWWWFNRARQVGHMTHKSDRHTGQLRAQYFEKVIPSIRFSNYWGNVLFKFMTLPHKILSLWIEIVLPGVRFCSFVIVETSCFWMNGLGEVNKMHSLWRRNMALVLRVFSEAFRISGNTSFNFCQDFFLKQSLVSRGNFKE